MNESIWRQAGDFLRDPGSWRGSSGIPHLTVEHLEITALAVLVAAAVALPAALWLGHGGRGGGPVTVLANASRSVPTYGVLVLFSGFAVIGFGDKATVYALALFALAPLLTNAYAGMRQVDPDAVAAARGLGMSGWQVLRRVEVPLALPLIAAGVRTATVQSVATATLAAFVGGGGLGVLINLGQGLGPTGHGELLVGAVAVALLTFAVELLLGVAQAAVTPGPQRRWFRPRTVNPGGAAVTLS